MDVVLALVKLGFTQNEILYDLTAKQARHYFELSQKHDEEQLKQLSVAVRLAHHADEKQFGKYMKGDM